MSKTTKHVAQTPHSAAECKINDAAHSHPDVDCGHYVDGPGPGTTPIGPSGTHNPGYVPDGPGHPGAGYVPAGPGHKE